MKLQVLASAMLLAFVNVGSGANLRSSILNSLEDASAMEDFSTFEDSMELDMSMEFENGAVVESSSLEEGLDLNMVYEGTEAQLLYRRPRSGKLVGLDSEDQTRCPRGKSTMYLLADPIENLWIVLCGKACTIRDSVKSGSLPGGLKCLGNTNVRVNLKGLDHPMFREEGEACVPYTDLEPQTAPENRVAMKACGLTNKLVAAPLAWLGKHISEFVFNGGIKKALTSIFGKYAFAADFVFKAAKHVGQRLGRFAGKAVGHASRFVGRTVGRATRAVGRHAKRIGGKVKETVKNIGSKVKNIGSKVKSAVKNVGGKIKNTVKNVGSKIKSAGKKVKGFFGKLFKG